MTIESLPLHDALLAAVYVSWEAERCDFLLRPVGMEPHLLTFEGFLNIELPRRESWGPSSSVNAIRQAQDGHFEIELQSGDVLRIEAPHWAFRPEAT